MPAISANSRSLRRLDRLSDAALVTKGDERALVVKTILKILDECSDSEYDVATAEPLYSKLIAAGIEFDDEESLM